MIREMLWKFRSRPKRATPHMRTRQNADMIRELSVSSTTEGDVSAPTLEPTDLNQKTMQALDTLAEEYEAFEVP